MSARCTNSAAVLQQKFGYFLGVINNALVGDAICIAQRI
jgi:hypothetical protein